MKRKQTATPSDERQARISAYFKATAPPTARGGGSDGKLHSAVTTAAAAAALGDACHTPADKRLRPGNPPLEVIEIDADITSPVRSGPGGRPVGGGAPQHEPQQQHQQATPADECEQLPQIPSVRSLVRYSKAQAKLVGAPGAVSLAEPVAPSVAGAPPRSSGGGSVGGGAAGPGTTVTGIKYTPLEQQVVALKAAHPGVR